MWQLAGVSMPFWGFVMQSQSSFYCGKTGTSRRHAGQQGASLTNIRDMPPFDDLRAQADGVYIRGNQIQMHRNTVAV